MTELQLLVKNYQDNNDNTIIKKIFDLIEIDYLKHPGRKVKTVYHFDNNDNNEFGSKYNETKEVTYDFPDPLMYVAYRLRAFREKIARQHLSKRSEKKETYEIFYEILYEICEEFNINYETKLADLLEQISNIDYNEFDKFLAWHEEYPEIYKEIIEYENYIESLKAATRKNLNEEFEIALRYALEKVDYNRSEKEIVTYLNMCFLTSWINYQLERDGKKRLQRYKGRISIVVKPEWEKPIKMILGTNNYSLELLEKLLLPKQFELIKNIINIIENDIKENFIGKYRLNNDGKTVLNKRYIAKQLGLSEDNLKHKLKRIKNRITKNNIEYFIYNEIKNKKTIKALKTPKEIILLELEKEEKNNFEMMNYLYEKKNRKRHTIT